MLHEAGFVRVIAAIKACAREPKSHASGSMVGAQEVHDDPA